MKKQLPGRIFYSTLMVEGLFLVLKFTGVIGWSWWWITAPIWMPFLIAAILVIAFFVLLRKYK